MTHNLGRLLTATLTFLFLIYIGILQLFANAVPPGEYSLITWKWDYSLGVIRRGFVGFVLHPFIPDPTPTMVLRVAIFIFLFCLVFYSIFSAIVIYKRPYLETLAIASLGVVLAPALPSFASSLGRLDQVNFLILVTCCLLIFYGGRIIPFIISVISSIAVLIHEGFLVVHFPLVCSLYLASTASKRTSIFDRGLGIIVAGPLLTLVILLRYCKPTMDIQDWIQYWHHHGPYVQYAAVGYLLANHVQMSNFSDDLGFVLEYSLLHKFSALYGIFVVLAIMPACFLLFRQLIKSLPNKNIWRLAVISCFSPLTMFILGVDFIRWTSYVTTNLVLLALSICFLEGPLDISNVRIKREHLNYIIPLVTFVLFCFAMTTGELWPGFGKYATCVYSVEFKPQYVSQYCNESSRATYNYQ